MKKLVALALCLVLCFSMTTIAFADVEENAYPNVVADVYVDNENCLYHDEYNISVKISKEGMEDIIVPLAYNEEDGCYAVSDRVDGLDDIINEVKVSYEGGDALDTFAEYGYTVEVIAATEDEEHIIEVESYVYLMTESTFRDALDMVVSFAESFIIEVDPTYEPTGNFDAFVEAWKNALLSEGYTEEEIQEEMAEAIEYQNIISMLESGEYAGELYIDAFIYCSCPELIYCEITHEFYDKNGEWVNVDWNPVNLEVGTVINIADIDKYTEYDGVEYEFIGAYLRDPETYELDLDNPIEEYVVHEEFIENEEGEIDYWANEIVLKYVEVNDDSLGDAEGDEGMTGGEQDDATLEDEDDATKEEPKEEPKEEQKEETKEDPTKPNVPVTGDETNLALYMVLMLAAAFVMKKVKA
ncbi:MAG: hypothetical protein IKU53_04385 [Firmicutes bacterium]|nr:hypothetical protein [Bacillota bacterium]